jgi:hypothetical protein
VTNAVPCRLSRHMRILLSACHSSTCRRKVIAELIRVQLMVAGCVAKQIAAQTSGLVCDPHAAAPKCCSQGYRHAPRRGFAGRQYSPIGSDLCGFKGGRRGVGDVRLKNRVQDVVDLVQALLETLRRLDDLLPQAQTPQPRRRCSPTTAHRASSPAATVSWVSDMRCEFGRNLYEDVLATYISNPHKDVQQAFAIDTNLHLPESLVMMQTR